MAAARPILGRRDVGGGDARASGTAPAEDRHDGALRLSDEIRGLVGARMRRIEGQLRGLQRMLAKGRDCAEIAQQMAAARAALDRAAMDLVGAGLEQCVRVELDGKPEARGALRRLQRTFLMLR